MIHVKRIYEPGSAEDGMRILVDRLWPRGVAKSKANIDRWLKEVGPSTELREWFGHEPKRWKGFQRRYAAELDAQPEAVQWLLDVAARDTLTLVFAARDTEHNNAVALRDYLRRLSAQK